MAERLVYRRVDRILALTPKLIDYVQRMGAKRGKVGLLLPGINTSLFHPGPKDADLMKK